MDRDLVENIKQIGYLVLFIFFIYCFMISINTLGTSFSLFGSDFAESLFLKASNPLSALAIGLLATAIVQSSSCTTSILVGLVATGMLDLTIAIPMIMGANIGTTVTNLLVSLGHIHNRTEFSRAFAGSTVHDVFNWLAVLILLPLEYFTHILENSATFLAELFFNSGGIAVTSPLKMLITPGITLIESVAHNDPVFLLIISLGLLFLSLKMIVDCMKGLVLKRFEVMVDSYLFRNASIAFCVGLIFTAIIQSSSITTSLVVPLVGAGILSVRKLFPYTLGANLGTTITALLAALAINSQLAITVAFVHLLFNLFAILIIYPFFRNVPIDCALKLGEIVEKKRRMAFIFVIVFFYILPLLIILLCGGDI